MNDMEKMGYGLITKEETWFYKKAVEYAKELENFCKEKGFRILLKYESNDGWDCTKFPAYIIETKSNEIFKVVCTESGQSIKSGSRKVGCQFMGVM